MTNLFHQALRREMPDILVDWFGEEKIGRDIDENLELELRRCDDEDFGEKFAAACPVDGCGAEDYLQRVLDIGGGQKLLTGIRFHGNLGFPFVDIIAAVEPLDAVESMADALDAVRASYAAFEPQAVRLMRSSQRRLRLPAGVEAAADQHVVVGPVDELLARPLVPGQGRVQIVAIDDVDEAVSFVNAAYEEFYGEHPTFRDIVCARGEVSLGRAQKTGVLVYIEVDGRRAGLLATREKLGPLVRGQSVVEEVVTAEFRGRGLACAAQRLVVERLARDASKRLLRGTIDDRNLASRATARRVGRHEVAAWHWLRWG